MEFSLSVTPDLDALDVKAIEIEEGISPSNIATILNELRDEQCAHSWRSFVPTDGRMPHAVDSLIGWEEAKRPTKFFSYYATYGLSHRDLIGVATVSEKISYRFPHEGFPVLARCYIRQRYRGHRLYLAILQQRLQYCCSRWGEGLKAIHLSSADARVARTVRNPSLLQRPFRRICMEQLIVRDAPLTVHAFLSFAEGYAEALRTASARAGVDPSNPECPKSLLGRALDLLLEGDEEIDLFDVQTIWRRASQMGFPSDPSVEQLLAFCSEFTPCASRREQRA